jgi:hypothetical protein
MPARKAEGAGRSRLFSTLDTFLASLRVSLSSQQQGFSGSPCRSTDSKDLSDSGHPSCVRLSARGPPSCVCLRRRPVSYGGRAYRSFRSLFLLHRLHIPTPPQTTTVTILPFTPLPSQAIPPQGLLHHLTALPVHVPFHVPRPTSTLPVPSVLCPAISPGQQPK